MKHKYLYKLSKRSTPPASGQDYACVRCGLNWKFDPNLRSDLAELIKDKKELKRLAKCPVK